MPGAPSSGVLTSKNALRNVSKRDLEKLYWRTSSAHSFEGRQLTEVDRNECFDQIHKVGQTNTKYMTFPEKRAPLMDRSSCTYSAEFMAKPSGHAAENRAFARTIKGGQRMRSAPSIGSKTTYHENFNQGRTPEQFQGATIPVEVDRQNRTQTLGGYGDSSEKASYAHSQHRGPHQELTSTSEKAHHKGNMYLPDPKRMEFWSTQYERDSRFCTDNSSARPPSAGPLEPLPEKHTVVTRGRPVAKDRIRLALPPGIAA